MRDIVAWHSGYRKNGDRTLVGEVNRLLVARSKLAIQVARIAAVRRNLFLRDGNFLHAVRKVRHIGEQHEDVLSLQCKLFCDSKRKVRNLDAFYRRVRRSVHEHDCLAQGAAFLKRVLKVQVVIIFQAHAAQNNHIYLSLHGNTCKQLVVRFAAYGKNRELLAHHERIEHVDHRNASTNHAVCKNTF